MSEISIETQQELQNLRVTLDDIDTALIFLLADRFRVTHTVGLLKAKHAMPPQDTQREAEQFEHIAMKAEKAGLNQEFAQRILRFIIDEVIKDHEALAWRKEHDHE